MFWDETDQNLTIPDRRYRAMISLLIWSHCSRANEIADNDGNKRLRFPPPSKYSGEDDPEKFEKWLAEICRYMSLTGNAGDAKDHHRVLYISQSLADAALEWYTSEMNGADPREFWWTFEKIIFGIIKNFVRSTSSMVAATKFETLRYSPSEGVVQFRQNLEKVGSRMAQRPTEYQISRQFVAGLPEEWVKLLTMCYNLNPDDSPFADIVNRTLKIERNAIAYKHMHRLDSSRARRPYANASTVFTSSGSSSSSHPKSAMRSKSPKRRNASPGPSSASYSHCSYNLWRGQGPIVNIVAYT